MLRNRHLFDALCMMISCGMCVGYHPPCGSTKTHEGYSSEQHQSCAQVCVPRLHTIIITIVIIVLVILIYINNNNSNNNNHNNNNKSNNNDDVNDDS